MLASKAARASPAAVSGGSAPASSTFSAWRTTTIVVESAVATVHAANPRTTALVMAVKASSQSGVKNGRCCRLAWLLMAESYQ